MSKRQLIDDIRTLNPTAHPQFLAQFEEIELQEYLEHLRDAVNNRIQIHGWAKKKSDLRMVS
jgi:hypothetical protein